MTNVYDYAYACAPNCRPIKMNPLPDYCLGKLEWCEGLLPLHVLLLRGSLTFIIYSPTKSELQIRNIV